MSFTACASAPPVESPAPTPAPVAVAAPAPIAPPLPSTLPELLPQIKSAYRRGNYDLGLALVKRAIELKQTDMSTYDRIGSIYFALGRYGEALSFWSRALPLEHDLKRRRALQNSIAATRLSLGLAPDARPKIRPKKPLARKGVKRKTARVIAALYKKGVKHYAEGEYLQATTAFMRILELDPGNVDAKKALERLRLEPAAGGDAPAP